MMSLAQINELSRRATVRAARSKKLPLVVEQQDVEADRVYESLRGIPFLGDYVPKGWRPVPRCDLKPSADVSQSRLDHLWCDDNYVFVDSSGFGQRGEGALAFDEFVSLASANVGIGWGIVEQGQFQVVVGAYKGR